MIADIIIQALALVGALVMVFLLVKSNAQPTKDGPLPRSDGQDRDSVLKGHRKRQKRIDEAVAGDDPIGDLTDIGNEWR